MKRLYSYSWALKFILAALLLGVGIYMVFANEVVYIITGVAILVFSILRVVPLLKTLNKEILRTLNLIEIIFDILLGGLMVYIALTRDLSSEKIWSYVYRYGLTFFFYARGLIYFNSVVFFGEKTEVPKFWIHIVALSIGVVIAVTPKFDYETVGIFLLIIALIGSIYLGYDGFGGYKKYRNFSKTINTEKTVKKSYELPSEIEEKEDERPYVN